METGNENKKVVKFKRRKISEFFLHLAAYGGFNVRDGMISLWNDLHVFSPVAGIYTLQVNLIKQYGDEAIELLYWLGKINGMTGTIALLKRYGFKRDNFIDLLNGASMDGWGKLELDEMVYENNDPQQATIICNNSTLAYKYKEESLSNNNIDHFIRGELAGGAQPLFNKPVIAEEINCIGKGDNSCKFVVYFTNENIHSSLIKKLNINTEQLVEKLTKITLTRKGRFGVFQKKNISFGDGELKLYNINGILMLSYVFTLLCYLLEKMNKENFQKILDNKIESDLDSIDSKINNARGYAGVLDLINIFGLGKSHIEIMSKEIILIKNTNNPFSKDYLNIFGKQTKGVDYYLGNLIRRAFEKKYNSKFQVEEVSCMAKGDRSCSFKLTFI